MNTLSTLLTFIGFWVCYQTSQRAELNSTNKLELWIRSNRSLGHIIGATALIGGLALSMITFGIGSGIFSFVMILTTVASLIIILSPLGYMKLPNVASVAMLAFILELAI